MGIFLLKKICLDAQNVEAFMKKVTGLQAVLIANVY